MFILEDLRSEIPVDPVQYGGMKGSSVHHLLIDLHEEMLAPLDEGKPSVVVEIDFEKAFNRLDHNECLSQLEVLGASKPSLRLVWAFLTERQMRVKVGQTLSAPRTLKGGSPQGSILGGYLYCATTQQIGSQQPAAHHHRGVHAPPPDRQGVERGEDVSVGDDEGFRMGAWMPGAEVINSSGSEDSFYTAEGSLTPRSLSPDDHHEVGVGLGGSVATFKYIDDTTTVETVDKEIVARHVTGTNPREHVPTPLTDAAIEGIIAKATDIGMKVNCQKTRVLCVSPDNGYMSTATVKAGEELLVSAPTIKLLGYTVDAQGGVGGQVDMIRKKFRRKLWALIHLRRAGFRGKKLYKLYASIVRPILETNSVVFHSMLNRGQTEDIEKLQRQALRLCFGFVVRYGEILEANQIKSLEYRITEAVRKFAGKTLRTNPRFADKWFIPRDRVDPDIRRRRPFRENRGETERYRKSPLANLQRVANDIMTRNENA